MSSRNEAALQAVALILENMQSPFLGTVLARTVYSGVSVVGVTANWSKGSLRHQVTTAALFVVI